MINYFFYILYIRHITSQRAHSIAHLRHVSRRLAHPPQFCAVTRRIIMYGWRYERLRYDDSDGDVDDDRNDDNNNNNGGDSCDEWR